MNQPVSFNPSAETPHHSIEAEQALLGAILCDNRTFFRVSNIVTPDHFYDPVHAAIFELAAKRINRENLASPVTLAPAMSDHDGLQELGGAKYLVRLAGAAIAVSAAPEYALMIVELAIKRQLDAAMVSARTGMASDDLSETVIRLQHALHAIPEIKGQEDALSMLAAATEAARLASAAWSGDVQLLATGIVPLDRILRGLGPGDLMLLGGSTSMGKTATAIEIADKVASSGDKSAAFWSLEMEPDQLASRMASSRSRVPYSSMRDPTSLEEADFRKWIDGIKGVSEQNMHIIPKRIRTIAGAHSSLKRMVHRLPVEAPLSLLVVDYAQLVMGEGKTRYEQMCSIPTDLKSLGGLLGIPVIALVQLDRNIGDRDDTRPQLRDIKESGQFENDADQVVFCHREEYWIERKGPTVGKDGAVSDSDRTDYQADLAAARNKMELGVKKNRHGRLATAEVGFHAATNRFWDLKDETAGFK